MVSVHYIGKKGTHLYFAGNNNLDVLPPSVEKMTPTQIGNLGNYVNNPFASVLTGSYYSNSSLTSPTVQQFQLMLPFPQFTGVTADEPPSANSFYNGLQIVVEKRYSSGLQLSANYTWSKSIDNSSTFDVPEQLKFEYSYDLPVGRGRTFFNQMPRALDLIVGGWKTAGVWTIHDGFPLQFTVTNGGTPIYTYGSQRPNLVGTPEFSGGSENNWINNYFANPNVFQAPAPYTLGNAPRTVGTVRSPFFFSTNLSILKEFAVFPRHEEMKLELRLEAQNAFNHPVFGTPNTYVGDPNFGVISNTSVGPRQCQLALKLRF
jgi:hypothetical protein